MSQSSEGRKRREGTRKGPKMVKAKRRKQAHHRQVTVNHNQKGGGSSPLASPLGRSPEDAVSAARKRSGALGSKASGATLRGKTGGGSPGRHPPISSQPLLDQKPHAKKRPGARAGMGGATARARRERPQGVGRGCANQAGLRVTSNIPNQNQHMSIRAPIKRKQNVK